MRISKMIKSEKNPIKLLYIVLYFFCMHRPGLYHVIEPCFTAIIYTLNFLYGYNFRPW